MARPDDAYAARFHRVTDYIETNLDSELSLDELAAIAHFSKFHFHRLFYGYQGETLFRFIRRLRLEKAASLLLTHPREAVIAIALDCGFENASAFSRAFREHFGVSASEWRRTSGRPTANDVPTDDDPLAALRASWNRHPMRQRIGPDGPVWESHTPDGRKREVRVRELDPVDVAYVRHVGPYAADADLFGRLFEELFAWAMPRGLVRYPLHTYCIYHDAPEITPEEKLRVSVCIPVTPGTTATAAVGRLTIPGGRYACTRMDVGPAEYGEAWAWTYVHWLPGSGFEPDDRNAFEHFVAESDGEMSAERRRVEICVPVRPA